MRCNLSGSNAASHDQNQLIDIEERAKTKIEHQVPVDDDGNGFKNVAEATRPPKAI